MSIKLMAKVWTLDVSGTEREILLVMADHADDFGNNARPSVSYIAWKVGCHARTVTRYLKELRRKNALQLVKSAGAHAPNEYRVTLDGYTPKTAFEYKGDTFHKTAPLPTRGDKLSPDKLSPDTSLSPKPPSSFNNNNNNNAPAEKPKSLSEEWYSDIEQLTGGYMGGAEEMKDLTAAWQNKPDVRRHNEAIRQTSQARSRTVKVYLKAYLTFNPDYVPPPQPPTRYPSRAETVKRAPPTGYTPPTEAERAAFHARLANAPKSG